MWGFSVGRVMSHFVSKVWRVLALCFAVVLSAPAQTMVSGTVGADRWDVRGGPARYLPDYSTPRPWSATSGWARLTVQHAADTEVGTLTLTGQGHMSQVTGNRVDRLDADLRLSDASGVRAGMLPYRVSWCRSYDNRSPWLSEPDAFCRFSGLNEVSQGAFGVQGYHSQLVGSWLIDSMAGVYRPMIDGQNDKLGPYVPVGPTVAHRAHGVSVNALHLDTGIQARAGWLRTSQDQDDTKPGGFQRQLRYDTLYLAAEGNVLPWLDVRGSFSAYLGDQVNGVNPFKFDGRSVTVEAIAEPAPGHSLAVGWSRYSNRTTYGLHTVNLQRLVVPTVSAAWRFDLPAGWWGVVQYTRTDDNLTSRTGAVTKRGGSAIGLRVARAF